MPSLLPPLHDGHAPIYLQHAFQDAVYAYEEWHPDGDEPRVSVNGKAAKISVIFRRLWNCSDLVPRHTLDAVKDLVPVALSSVQLKDETTFAEAASIMRDSVKRRKVQFAIASAH